MLGRDSVGKVGDETRQIVVVDLVREGMLGRNEYV